jgi:Glycerophosphoryl diester phosphodiesterase family
LQQTPEFIADCHRRGLKIWAWTVNMQTMVDLLVRRGIDGVCTDYPELVTSALQRHGSPVSSGASTPVTTYSTAVVPAAATAAPVAEPAAPASACQRALDLIYNELASARTAVAAAVGESQCMNTALLQRTVRAPLTTSSNSSTSESSQLTVLLAAATACAEEVLQPVLMSAKTFAWMAGVLQSEAGKKLLADVAADLADSSLTCPLLPFERKYLSSVSTLA